MNKIAFLVHSEICISDDHQVGGGELSNYFLILKLLDKFEIDVFPIKNISCNKSVSKPQDTFKVIKSKYSGQNRVSFFFQKIFFFKNRVSKIFKTKKYKYIVSTRSTLTIGNELSKKFNIPHVTIVRAYEDFDGGILNKDTESVYRRIDRFIYRNKTLEAFHNCYLIITNSNFMKNKILSVFPKLKVKISYPILGITANLKNIYEFNKIGFINRSSIKGDGLVKDLAKLMKDKTFFVFGKNLEGALSNNIINKGYISDRDLIFRSVDLFIVPSIWEEPYGRVASEAILSGIPVLVSKIGGLIEAAPNQLFWVNTLDPEEWKYKIKFFEKNINLTLAAIKLSQEIINSYQHDEVLS